MHTHVLLTHHLTSVPHPHHHALYALKACSPSLVRLGTVEGTWESQRQPTVESAGTSLGHDLHDMQVDSMHNHVLYLHVSSMTRCCSSSSLLFFSLVLPCFPSFSRHAHTSPSQ